MTDRVNLRRRKLNLVPPITQTGDGDQGPGGDAKATGAVARSYAKVFRSKKGGLQYPTNSGGTHREIPVTNYTMMPR